MEEVTIPSILQLLSTLSSSLPVLCLQGLGKKELVGIRRLNKQWREFVNQPPVWKYHKIGQKDVESTTFRKIKREIETFPFSGRLGLSLYSYNEEGNKNNPQDCKEKLLPLLNQMKEITDFEWSTTENVEWDIIPFLSFPKLVKLRLSNMMKPQSLDLTMLFSKWNVLQSVKLEGLISIESLLPLKEMVSTLTTLKLNHCEVKDKNFFPIFELVNLNCLDLHYYNIPFEISSSVVKQWTQLIFPVQDLVHLTELSLAGDIAMELLSSFQFLKKEEKEEKPELNITKLTLAQSFFIHFSSEEKKKQEDIYSLLFKNPYFQNLEEVDLIDLVFSSQEALDTLYSFEDLKILKLWNCKFKKNLIFPLNKREVGEEKEGEKGWFHENGKTIGTLVEEFKGQIRLFCPNCSKMEFYNCSLFS